MSTRIKTFVAVLFVLTLIASCGQPQSTDSIQLSKDTPPSSPHPSALPTAVARQATSTPASGSAANPAAALEDGSLAAGLTVEEAATLSSLRQVDGFPLYTMNYQGEYQRVASSTETDECLVDTGAVPAWACSLFAALGNPDDMLYGRNFDWRFSPALLLFTDPPDGYASVSMVDIAYLGYGGSRAYGVADLPLGDRRALLNSPFLPFDGMNEHGVAVGMAAVPPGHMRPDPSRQTIDSLGVMREILDHARNVDEASIMLQAYNIDMGDGPPLHYLIADRSGRSLLLEFYQGELVVIPNATPWHQATNFLRSSAGESAAGECWRYDRINQRLEETEGEIGAQEALALLSSTSQSNTQWSIVYGMSTGEINVAMGRQYDKVHTFHLGQTGEALSSTATIASKSRHGGNDGRLFAFPVERDGNASAHVHLSRFERSRCLFRYPYPAHETTCGHQIAPEDRNQPDGRGVKTYVGVSGSRSTEASPDPVTSLAGGGGAEFTLTVLRDYPDVVRSAVIRSVFPPQVGFHTSSALNAHSGSPMFRIRCLTNRLRTIIIL